MKEQLPKSSLRQTEVEEELQVLNEKLEEQIKQRTVELICANNQFKAEIQERAVAAAEVRRVNTELE